MVALRALPPVLARGGARRRRQRTNRPGSILPSCASIATMCSPIPSAADRPVERIAAAWISPGSVPDRSIT